MKKRKLLAALLLIFTITLCASCAVKSGNMKDGYYTAEGAVFNAHGWKEFVTIYVSGDRILTVEYDAYNASGFVRSWDINYMRVMNRISGTYPNAFTRAYTVALINWQDSDAGDAISGATESHVSFRLLAKAAIEQAKAGDSTVVLVDLSETNKVTEG